MAYEKLKRKWDKDRKDEIRLAGFRRDLLIAKGVPVLKAHGIKRAVLFGSL
jgi:hypothetical protein